VLWPVRVAVDVSAVRAGSRDHRRPAGVGADPAMSRTPIPEIHGSWERSRDGDFLYLLQIYGVIAMHRGLQGELIAAAQAVVAPPASEHTKNEPMTVWQLLAVLAAYAHGGHGQHKIFVVTAAAANMVKDDREQEFDAVGWTVVDSFQPYIHKDEFVALTVRPSFPQFFRDAPEVPCVPS
jgi:hypothetical protein